MRPLVFDSPLLRHYGAEGGRHAHDHAQVLFGLEGTLEMEVEGHAAWVDATCGLVIPAGRSHAYRARTEARVLVVDCDPGAITDRFRRFALPAGWPRQVRTQRPDLATLLGTAASAPAVRARRRIDLDALAARIAGDLARRWTVDDLAAACCLSPQRLRARLAQALGCSPQAFVRARRLDAATRLLRQGMGLEAVALAVGYGGAPALSTALRRDRDTGARALRANRAVRES
jgi:AraC-like DNA-binding protein